MTPDSSSLYDPLTGLVGPTLLQDRLHMAMARARRHSCSTALLLISVDDFLDVLETDGKEAGDDLVRDAGHRIDSSLRSTDTVARIEGSVFAVILEDVLIVDNTLVVVEKIIKLFEEPFTVSGKNRTFSVSLGVAAFPHNGDTHEDVFNRAYACLREAFARPGNSYEVAPFDEKKAARRAV
jgi:diguanylate cyclase (GGDEF)-like protein